MMLLAMMPEGNSSMSGGKQKSESGCSSFSRSPPRSPPPPPRSLPPTKIALKFNLIGTPSPFCCYLQIVYLIGMVFLLQIRISTDSVLLTYSI